MRLVDPTGGRGERARRPAAEGGEEKFVPLGGSRRAAVERKGPATTTRCSRRTDLEPGRGGRDADREPARSVRRDRIFVLFGIDGIILVSHHLVHAQSAPGVRVILPPRSHRPNLVPPTFHHSLGLCRTRRRRFHTDDPHPSEQDGAPQRDQEPLHRAEGVELTVIDQAGEDRRGVVKAEGGRADEGRTDEAEGAVQVRELCEFAYEQDDQEHPRSEMAKLIVAIDEGLDDQVHAGLGEQEAQATQRAGRGPVRDREPEPRPFCRREDLVDCCCCMSAAFCVTAFSRCGSLGRGRKVERAWPDGVDSV